MIKTYLDWAGGPAVEEGERGPHRHRQRARRARRGPLRLQDVKERIIEYLAVRKLVAERGRQRQNRGRIGVRGHGRDPVLCRTPGVGKTSLGKEHRPGAGPQLHAHEPGRACVTRPRSAVTAGLTSGHAGRIIQAIKRAGTRNRCSCWDEGRQDRDGLARGSQQRALEVLDPARTIPSATTTWTWTFDLSNVIFITTANQLETIPAPLRDRMEIITLDGYTEHEKLQIAKRHLLPRQLRSHGLKDEEMTFTETPCARSSRITPGRPASGTWSAESGQSAAKVS